MDTSVQKGFVSGLPGVFEHIYSLSTIMQDAATNKNPLMMTFLDLKNAFGSVSHRLIVDMLQAVKVPNFYPAIYSLSTQYYQLSSQLKLGKRHPFHFVKGFFKEIHYPL